MVGCQLISYAYISRFDVPQNRTHKLTSGADPRNAPPMPKSVMVPEALKCSIIMIVNVPYDLDKQGIFIGGGRNPCYNGTLLLLVGYNSILF